MNIGIVVQSAHEPFRGVNYKELARSIRFKRQHEEDNLRMLQQGRFDVSFHFEFDFLTFFMF